MTAEYYKRINGGLGPYYYISELQQVLSPCKMGFTWLTPKEATRERVCMLGMVIKWILFR